VGAIVLAAILDAVDGRLARMLKATSRFGAELDSLADFVNFGVAPALVIYIWMTDSLGAIGWLGALVFVIACALRLARFNASSDETERPAWAVDFFVGVPAPAGALIALLPMYLGFIFGMPGPRSGPGQSSCIWSPQVMLMGSQVPTFSAKRTLGVLCGATWWPRFSPEQPCSWRCSRAFPFSVLAAGTMTYLALHSASRSCGIAV
jgi:CDP-diacylglycerol--serine O-phosphatidyltransferase